MINPVSWTKHLRAILFLPALVTVLVPAFILYSGAQTNIGWLLPSPWNWLPLLIGILLIVAGLTLLVRTIALFVRVGQGTLAPWDPTRRLVAQGIYRHVRNPMITGVFCILFGESIVLGALAVFFWLLTFVLLNLIYIPLVEEPDLERRFGDDYRLYRANVPRWIPRLRAWQPVSRESNSLAEKRIG